MIIEVTQEMREAWGIPALIEIIERDYVVRRRARPRTKTSSLPRGGRQYLDPGPEARCARCYGRRRVHGGAKHFGACPGQTNNDGLRFRLREEDKKRA